MKTCGMVGSRPDRLVCLNLSVKKRKGFCFKPPLIKHPIFYAMLIRLRCFLIPVENSLGFFAGLKVDGCVADLADQQSRVKLVDAARKAFTGKLNILGSQARDVC